MEREYDHRKMAPFVGSPAIYSPLGPNNVVIRASWLPLNVQMELPIAGPYGKP
jgi:hypothetical protein